LRNSVQRSVAERGGRETNEQEGERVRQAWAREGGDGKGEEGRRVGEMRKMERLMAGWK
jgi:hypothetical protein